MKHSLLFVITPNEAKRYEMISHIFASKSDVEVVHDRRVSQRRTQREERAFEAERRRRDRRSHDIGPELSVRGWACVRRPGGSPTFWLPRTHRLLETPRYEYFRSSTSPQTLKRKLEAAQLSEQILHPALRDPNFLVLRERRRLFSGWIGNLPRIDLRVLDVGGRLQPYRSLLSEAAKCYVGIDPLFEGLLDVIGVGEALPFRRATFDLVICTQVLNYTDDPFRLISEIHRVLRRGGALFLSAPAIFPRYVAQRWRFMPEGLMVLLSPFSFYEIVPEGQSIAGLCRLVNLFVDTVVLDAVHRAPRARRLIASVVFPIMNLAGLAFDGLSRGNSRFTTNYTCLALK